MKFDFPKKIYSKFSNKIDPSGQAVKTDEKKTFSPKIFGIGLNKTGTTTLGRVLMDMGKKHCSCRLDILNECREGKFEKFFETISRRESFEDWPWPLYFRLIDCYFPNSKFILTTRISVDVWLESLKKHSLRTGKRHCRSLAYGLEYPHLDEKYMKDFYTNHNNYVRDYFKGRNNDFLEICWERGDDLEKVYKFLNKPITENLSIPHLNKSTSKKTAYNIQRLKKLGINI